MRNSSRLARSLRRFAAKLDPAFSGVEISIDTDGDFTLGDDVFGCVRSGDPSEIMIGASTIIESCPIKSPELAGRVRLRWITREIVATAIHELGHVVASLRRPASDRHLARLKANRPAILETWATTSIDCDDPRHIARERAAHGAEFARVAWHLTHRAARLGVAACPGEVFRPRSHGWRFGWQDAERLLRGEVESLARVPIVALADTPAPAEFTELFTADYSAEG